MNAFSRVGASVALALLVGTTTARADTPDLGDGSAQQFFANQDQITVTFLYSLAAADNDLYLFTSVGSFGHFLIAVPGDAPTPGTPSTTSITFNLSTYGLDYTVDEVIFGICTTNVSGDTAGCSNPRTAFYMGPASRNPDNMLHAAVITPEVWNGFGVGGIAPAGTYVLGFENRTAADRPTSDWDYNDLVFAVDLGDPTTTTPEPATMFLLATGLVALTGVGLIRHRRSASR